MTDYIVEGWDEFVEGFESLTDMWAEKLNVLLRRIGTILLREVNPLIPVDTSRLVSSFSIEVGGDYVKYYSNVEYALYVDEGHIQHRRFLPVSYLSAGGRAKYIKSADQTGIMLKERYVPGVHYIDKGFAKAEPRIESICESFMEQISREMEGGSL